MLLNFGVSPANWWFQYEFAPVCSRTVLVAYDKLSAWKATAPQRGLLERVRTQLIASPGQTPAYLLHCDIGIIPHTDEAFTRSMEPHKAYNYAAAGIPTVALHAPHAPALDGLVSITRSGPEFADAVARAAQDGSLSPVEMEYARSLTWDRVAASVMSAATPAVPAGVS